MLSANPSKRQRFSLPHLSLSLSPLSLSFVKLALSLQSDNGSGAGMAVLMIMAEKSNNSRSSAVDATTTSQEVKPTTMFHDFLGGRKTAASASETADMSLSASIRTFSDLGSEKQARDHLEGVPFYGPRSDSFSAEMSNRLIGSKRNNHPDSGFTSHESLESLPLMKMLRHRLGVERPRGYTDLGLQNPRPPSMSPSSQPLTGRRVILSPTLHYSSHGGQGMPLRHQLPSSRLKDTNSSPSISVQTASDEGSRTGMKGHGILTSNNIRSGAADMNSSWLQSGGSRQNPVTCVSEPESCSPSQQGSTFVNRQMTIFYGGQAHVFDDVHPNKADVIMALASSNGGSWSTIYSPKSTPKLANDSYAPSRESDGGEASKPVFRQDHVCGTGSNDQISTPSGGHASSKLVARDATKEKRDA